MSEIKRQVSMTHSLAIIIGTVIGSGVFLQLPIVQQAAGSPGLAVVAWIIGGLIWLPQLFILAEMGTAYPNQGFGYLYLQKAGSPALAFLYPGDDVVGCGHGIALQEGARRDPDPTPIAPYLPCTRRVSRICSTWIITWRDCQVTISSTVHLRVSSGFAQ